MAASAVMGEKEEEETGGSWLQLEKERREIAFFPPISNKQQ